MSSKTEHVSFIISPIELMMRDAISAVNLLGSGMEVCAVSDFLLQSLFIKMTGALEQKMKCICWEIATDDLQYRYDRYYGKGWSLGQCSDLNSKTEVYNDLCKAIKRHDPSYKLFCNTKSRMKFVGDVKSVVTGVLGSSVFEISRSREYNCFVDSFDGLCKDSVAVGDKLLSNGLATVYKSLYLFRNRCAHNSRSSHLNIPYFSELRNSDYLKYDNIFSYFATILIVDTVFCEMFRVYDEVRDINVLY